MGGRRVEVGRVEGLFLVCSVCVFRVLVPTEFVVTAAALFSAVFTVVRSICWVLWFIGTSVLAITASLFMSICLAIFST